MNIRPIHGLLLALAATATSVYATDAPTATKGNETKVDPKLRMTDSVISDIGAGDRTRPFPAGEKVLYFTNIKDGDKVRSPFRVAFAVSGMGVSPVSAGAIKNTGHHHILIDMPLPVDIKAPVRFHEPGELEHQHYKHFGGGETETVLDLPPGKHTLRLLFADHEHRPSFPLGAPRPGTWSLHS